MIKVIKPQPRQAAFLSNPADIVIYGGAAGGGKSWALEADPLRHIRKPRFRGMIFRRTFAQVAHPGGLWDQSMRIYSIIRGAVPVRGKMLWRFPLGSTIGFGHLQHESSVYDYQGSEIGFIGFDELDHFAQNVFFYMFSRNRSTAGLRPYIRATVNANAESWVANLLEWWIDQETGFPIMERSGMIRWFVRINDEILWADDPDDLTRMSTATNPIIPKSLSFVPATVYDNKILLESNPEYLANLLALPPVDRERLLKGNWKIKAEAGKVFDRAWYEIIDDAPMGGVECLFWDFAATEKKLAKDDPDYTAAVSVKYRSGRWYITNVWFHKQANPAVVEESFRNLSRQFARRVLLSGGTPIVRFEVEPGSAAKRDAQNLIKMLPELDVMGEISSGDKLQRAKPLASQSVIGNVKVVSDQQSPTGKWNELWLSHMHHQPELPHDDLMDASAGAYNQILVYLGITNVQARQQSVSFQSYT